MATEIQSTKTLSSSSAIGGKQTKSIQYRVVSDSATEPEDAEAALGFQEGDLMSGSTMRCSRIRSELEEITALGDYVWNVTADFETLDGDTEELNPQDGTEIWTINGQMQQETVKYAIKQTPMASTGGKESVPVGNCVGLKGDGTVEGAPWGVPTTTLSVTLYKDKNAINTEYVVGCIGERGKVNSDVFYGFAAGEVRLESISIPKKMEDLWALQFDFAIRRNEAMADLPKHPAIDGGDFVFTRDVLGWEYAWIREAEVVTGTNMVETKAEGLYIAKFFKDSDFSALGLSGSLF
jgi:hypothetical protein